MRTTDYLAICEAGGAGAVAYARRTPLRVLVPMSLADRAVGVLALWSADRAYSRADEELLTTVAALAASRARALQASHLRSGAADQVAGGPWGARRAVLDGVGGSPAARTSRPRSDERDPRAGHLRVGDQLPPVGAACPSTW